ncbi:unnamed protein product [Mycena citricolor]|uniref:Uncharacterized protein n=1 Tax=Mycena citricolor TaxID=2018698 RepID=A0AAD2K1L9_9AGAR|nr:unnamed protein product [Mycena citricolor]CAK5273864.1 unnamed protein product [Mycena citricolor]
MDEDELDCDLAYQLRSSRHVSSVPSSEIAKSHRDRANRIPYALTSLEHKVHPEKRLGKRKPISTNQLCGIQMRLRDLIPRTSLWTWNEAIRHLQSTALLQLRSSNRRGQRQLSPHPFW